jgi:hypothetical protein
MILLYAEWNKLTLKNREALTSGSVNVNQVQFTFSSEWAGLDRVAVFRCDDVSVSVPLDDTNICTIPWETVAAPQKELYAGVYGMRGEETVLPTTWADLGRVLRGTTLGSDATDPTASPYQWVLTSIGDLDDLKTNDKSSLVAAINEARATGGGGGFETDETLSFKNGVLSVNTAGEAEEDNTLPITSAAVAASIGNIEELLKTI